MSRLTYIFAFLFAILLSQANAQTQGSQDIYTTLLQSDNYTIFTQLLDFTGLNNTLATDQNLTVFAPQDSALVQVPRWLSRVLLTNQGKPLVTALIAYHIANGTVTTSQVPTNGSQFVIEAIDDLNITLSANQTGTSNVTVDQVANIVDPDIQASNGVIQGIDNILTFTYPLAGLQFPQLVTLFSGVRRPQYVPPVPQPVQNVTSAIASASQSVSSAIASASQTASSAIASASQTISSAIATASQTVSSAVQSGSSSGAVPTATAIATSTITQVLPVPTPPPGQTAPQLPTVTQATTTA